MNQGQARNCWEYWECNGANKQRCPAYKADAGRECYLVTNFLDKSDNAPKVIHKFSSCGACPWYKIVAEV